MNEETAAAPSFTIQLFGPMQIASGGQPLPRPRNRRALWILALLALRDGEVSRDWLAETLWPESQPAQAAYNFRRSLSELRAVLEDEARRLESPTPQTLRLDCARSEIDSHHFERLLKRGTPADLDAVLACYKGDLLEGCSVEWVELERQRFRDAYLVALEKRAAQHTQSGEWERAAALLRQLIAREPMREAAHCRLMETLAAQGHLAEVTQVYRAFRLTLHTELRTAPHPDTDALYQCLKSAPNIRSGNVEIPNSQSPIQNPAPAFPAFPNPLTPLLGRVRELAELAERTQTARLVTLKGPGGSGKTRLSIALGHALRERFAGQIWFVSLAELPDAQRLAETVRDALNIQPDDTAPFQQIVNRLISLPSLLILDNYEHLIADGTRFIRDLLAAAPLLHCVVTSRHSLHLAGEIEYPVAPLALPGKADTLTELLQFAGVRLFVERASARRADFALTAQNAETVTALCARLEGIPLALELAAAWADTLTPAQMLSRLDARFSFPANPRSEVPGRHRSLQTAFDGSYALLDEAERRLLRRLSVFAGGWTLEAAEAVCEDGPESEFTEGQAGAEDAENGNRNTGKMETISMLLLLKRLIEKSLVVFRESPPDALTPSRYALHEMTRQYAQGCLSERERIETESRHTEYYFADALRRELDLQDKETGGTHHRRMFPDKENYLAAHQRLDSAEPERALDLLLTLYVFNLWTPSLAVQDEWIARLETQFLPPPTPLQAKLYLHVAFWAQYRGDSRHAALTEKAYCLAEGARDTFRMTQTLLSLAGHDTLAGNTARAQERLQTVQELAQSSGNHLQYANVEHEFIRLACTDGAFAEAQQRSEALLQRGREKNHHATMVRALEALSDIAIAQKELNQGQDYLAQVFAMYPETETVPRSNILRALSRLAAQQADFARARDYLAQSVAVCQASGDLAHEAWTYYEFADIARQQENNSEGLVWMRQAVRLFDLRGEVRSISFCFRRMARLSAEEPTQAAFFWFACHRFVRETKHALTEEQQTEYAAAITSLQTTLTESVCTSIEKRCAGMSLREVIRCGYLPGSR